MRDAARVRPLASRARLWRAEVLNHTRIGRRANLASYCYSHTPPQLAIICSLAETATAHGGAIVEVGVAGGMTTVFLNKHLEACGRGGRQYLALDTFSGFTQEDIAGEARAGRNHDYQSWFTINSVRMFQRSMRQNGIDNVVAIETDAATFDYGSLPPIAFGLIDVDLERPVAAALSGCWSRLVPGGILVVDDCRPGTIWEGALVAYEKGCANLGLAPEVLDDRLGVLRRPPVSPAG